ncbi:MAG: zinc-binding dehydrogenase [Clostridia bacterium]|nr:zinc-binding dehydrogenase [Clostridia bacterium]
MKLYSANGNKVFNVVEQENTAPEDFIKLKISLLHPTLADLSVFEGKLDIGYPRVPCRLATAVVSEDRPEYGLKLGSRVLLNPYVNPNGYDDEGYTDVEVYGIHKDGFLRDFVSMPIDNVIPFPEEVKEDEAIFADIVAVALRIINEIKPEKGDYIALIGGSLLMNITAQLALYYQAIPIVITADKRFLRLAEEVGVYYTVDESVEDVNKKVFSITGGRMADHTVQHALENVTPKFTYSLASRGADCIIAALNSVCIPRQEVDIGMVASKNLTVKGVSGGIDEFNSAINVLAQKILSFDGFIDKTMPLSEAKELFDELSRDYFRYQCAVIRV